MAKRMLIDAAHPEETRVVVLSGNRLEEFDFETSTKKQIKGNIYLAKVTRVEPSLQAAFVEYGGNRHGFLAFSEIHPDYYRIPVADRRAALAADQAENEIIAAREDAAAHQAQRVSHLAPPEERWGEPPSAQATDDHPVQSDDGPQDSDPYAAFGYSAASARREDGGDANAIADAESVAASGGFETASADRAGTAEAAAGDQPTDAGAAIEEVAPDYRRGTDEEDDHEADTVETLGGDEIEEATRQRARPFRHYKIQEVIKRRQIMLVQVTKEERGNKGAALTTYISLAGRYCVLMPNTPRGGGVSRKITSVADRRRLKELLGDLDVPEGMGVIVRTAGSERSKAEIKRDFEYLLRLWDEIRDLTLRSTAPALIYEEGNLIKRSIRDLYARDLEEVIVDGEEGYRTAKAFMRMLMPSHAKRVKPYRDPTVPLFHRFQVEGQIDAIHSPVVQLRSGGYIVINPTEALVAIDVNSGRSTKERNIEETALKTNIEAAEEIARQLRLRDLAGLIVIDFIDMEESRNQGAVERRLKDAMRHDRARIQLGRISPFGLLELSRQRLRPSLLEASTQPCPYCNGTGHIRSTESTALHVLRAIEEEGMRRRSAEISVAVPTAVALYILNQKRDALVHSESRYGLRVAVTSDDTLIPPAFRLERLRALTPAELAALPVALAPLAEPDEEEEEPIEEEEAAAAEGELIAAPPGAERGEERSDRGDGPGRRRRRRRRPGSDESRDVTGAPTAVSEETVSAEAGSAERLAEPGAEGRQPEEAPAEDEDREAEGQPGEAVVGDGGEGGRKRRRRGRRGGRRRRRIGPDGLPLPGEEAVERESAVAAETVELVREAPPAESAVAEMELAIEAGPPSIETSLATESVPIAEHGEALAPTEPESVAEAPQPIGAEPPAPVVAPAGEAPPTAAEPAAESPQPEKPPAPSGITEAQTVTGRPTNPKRGWWQRLMQS